MAEALSQSQIDALLKGLQQGEVAPESEGASRGKRVKEYDFKSPKKFTKEQLRTLDSLHENLSRMLSTYLTGVLRFYCEARVMQIEEQRYYEYNNALPDSALIAMVELKPEDSNFDEATLMLDLSTQLGFSMIDRLLGGSGDEYNLKREFTEVEVAILGNIFNKFAQYIREAWNSYIHVTTTLTSLETNPRLLQIHAPEDVVVIVLLEIKLKNLVGTMSICIPAMNLEELMANFANKYARAPKRQYQDDPHGRP